MQPFTLQKHLTFMRISTFFLLTLCALMLVQSTLFAQISGIKGVIKDAKGITIPFASIYAKSTQTGTASNQDGAYELRLPAGTHQVTFQVMGYETFETTVTVGKEMQNMPVTLVAQAYSLSEVALTGNSEDPAYTIMRKAIAMSKIHKLQVDAYSARLYIKGTTQILNIPDIVQKQMEKEGKLEGKTFLSETITDITFEQPNKYTKNVLSMRSSDVENNSVSPMDYIQASFYDPKMQGILSPLAPSAFAYYKFYLESTFTDQNYEVNKIKVTPRSKGDDVWEGFIYIIEDKWCIHSLELTTIKMGITIDVKQLYAPIQDGVFMPITHQFKILGKILGFKAAYNYLASVSNYNIKVNPIYNRELKLIDEKIERERAGKAKEARKEQAKKGKNQDLESALSNGEELTRKNLRKLIKETEKKEQQEERKNTKSGEIPASQLIKNDSTTIDSLAKQKGKDELFWLQNRPIPLANDEIKSYQERDSLVKVDSTKKTTQIKDSITGKVRNTKKFRPWDLVLGGTYKAGKQASFSIVSILESMGYNTVEGFASNFKLAYEKNAKRHTFTLSGLARYATARNLLTGKGEATWTFRTRQNADTSRFRQHKLKLDGGRYIQQINGEYPIPSILNTAYSLLFEQNYMKLYEQDYARLRWEGKLNDGLSIETSLQYAHRRGLENRSAEKIFDWTNRDYTSNNPENVELNETALPTHTATTIQVKLAYKPYLQYGLRNGRKYLVSDKSPTISLEYRKGLMDINYDFVSLGLQHYFNIGIRGKVGYAVSAGSFLSKNKLYLPDYKHFNGNRMFVQFADAVSSFRILDYYKFSTADKYIEGHAYIQLRKFLLTQFTTLRMFGIKENIFVNQLLTPKTAYTEAGYTLDGIFRIFRLEGVASFENGKYANWGIRIGITTTFGVRIGNND